MKKAEPVRNEIYYFFKPLIPRRLQISLRRKIIQFQVRKYKEIWPIDENAAKSPVGWSGWPDGKKFALVLTHDVDTKRGHDRCRQLARLEKELGFRSSFNFVPERYDVSRELREHLVSEGFEVGVHGLRHDGKYFISREEFQKRAQKINQYMKEWKAVGYRSPSMQSNLEWFEDLHIEYDASTFDTDPFEPQPEGMMRIFPFVVSSKTNRTQYVELPYTLPQDFTLFCLLREKNIDIWKKKLDWIVAKGGMALLNVHPDYMNFNGESGADQYPAHYYEQLLTYIRERYDGQCWHALPKEISRFWSQQYGKEENAASQEKSICALRKTSPLRTCMLAYTFYESDGRVRRYAEALARRGDRVDVIALRRDGQPKEEMINGVHVYRIQKRRKDEKRKMDYLMRISKFFITSAYVLAKRHLKMRYDLIHVHSVPDVEVFAALVPKLTGAKIILDIHDIVPEFYASKFNVGKDSAIYKTLVHLEQASSGFSDHVIIANHLWYPVVTSRSVARDDCTVMLNYPDDKFYEYPVEQPHSDKLIMLYPGTLNWHQGLDIAVNAFAQVAGRLPKAEFHIIGEGPTEGLLRQMIAERRMENRIFLKDFVSHDEIVPIMAGASLGIVPKRANSFGNEAFSTKILEFMALGVPVIVSDTKIDKYYFNDSLVKFFKAGDADDLARCMLEMAEDPDTRSVLAKNASEFIREQSWAVKHREYFDLVDRLVNNNREKQSAGTLPQ